MSDSKRKGSILPALLSTGTGGIILLITLSFVHPFGNPRRVDANSSPVLAGAQVPPQVRDVIERKCGNCHSEAVRWPFYSHMAPVSWLLERDVMEAREHMNLSRWRDYTAQERSDLLGRLGGQARSGNMPPGRYTMIHRVAVLQPEERELLYQWARTERKRLKAEALQPKGSSE